MCAAQGMWKKAHAVQRIKDLSLQKYHDLRFLKIRVMNNAFGIRKNIVVNVAKSKAMSKWRKSRELCYLWYTNT